MNNRIDPTQLFGSEANINHDVLILIKNYLRRCGLNATATILKNEAGIHFKHTRDTQKQVKQAVLEGLWEQVRELGKKSVPPKSRKAFLYLANKQELLELVNLQGNDIQVQSTAAFSHLIRRLKPLEAQARLVGDDFRDLAYLTTCRSVTDSPTFRNWEGVESSRRKLIKELGALIAKNDLFHHDDGFDDDDEIMNVPSGEIEADQESIASDDDEDGGDEPKPIRLVSLLQQAYAYQVEKTYVEPLLKSAPKISSLLVDYSAPIFPNRSNPLILAGHEQSVKCLEFIRDRSLVAAGSSDSTVILWDIDKKGSWFKGQGHTGRIWDVSSNNHGSCLVSASADSTIRTWDLSKISYDDENCLLTSKVLNPQHTGDIYSVKFHPESNHHIVTAGHDQTIRLIDIETEKVVKIFRGHSASVVHAVFNPVGNFIVTGSKDLTVKFFDIVSGLCVKTFPQLLGEVTSVEFSSSGDKLLTSTKDSSNRLWDIRTGTVLQRFKGHVNSSKNFIRAQFGSCNQIVIGGSEDGAVYVWDSNNGNLLDRLIGHSGTVFRATWSSRSGLLGSCAEDGTVRIWEPRS